MAGNPCTTRKVYDRPELAAFPLRGIQGIATPASVVAGPFLADFCVDVFVQARVRALHVVPPVAHQPQLVEDGPVGAQERVLACIGVTHVEDLVGKEKARLVRVITLSAFVEYSEGGARL